MARFGEHWYRELGTSADPGSALVTISGAVRAPGVYELAFGTSMTDLVDAAGGATEPLRALLVGGYFGTWVGASDAMALRLAREDLRSVGCTLGAGVLIALGESSCGLHESARVIDYLAKQSAGQCGPCVYGLRAIADSFGAIADGVAHDGERERVLRWARRDPRPRRLSPPRRRGAVRRERAGGVRGEIEWHRHERVRCPPPGCRCGGPSVRRAGHVRSRVGGASVGRR